MPRSSTHLILASVLHLVCREFSVVGDVMFPTSHGDSEAGSSKLLLRASGAGGGRILTFEKVVLGSSKGELLHYYITVVGALSHSGSSGYRDFVILCFYP